jgi:hypothetical protein
MRPEKFSSGGAAAHHDVGVAALLEVRIKDRFCRPRTGPVPLRHLWRIDDSAPIYPMICALSH